MIQELKMEQNARDLNEEPMEEEEPEKMIIDSG